MNKITKNIPYYFQNHIFDLRMIKNIKLRKLLTKGPNYRKPRFLNYTACLNSVKLGLDNRKDFRYSKDRSEFNEWKKNIISTVENKISLLKRSTRVKKIKSVLKDPDVVTFLKDLHLKFVLVQIDKASNNIAIICKKFYVTKLLTDVLH